MLSTGRLAFVCALTACAHTYPNSPQWHGDRFANPADWPRRGGMSDFFRWQHSRPSPPPFSPPVVHNDGARQRQNHTLPSLTWIGHSTVLIQGGGVSLLTDPVFSDDLGGIFPRFAPPGIAFADLPPIDVVVISHNHRDHLDEPSVRRLGPRVQYVVPLGLGQWFRHQGLPRVTELDWWQSTTLHGNNGAAIVITMVPAQHWSARLLHDFNRSLWGGYVIDAGGVRFYFAGDTAYPPSGELFREIGRRMPNIDYALLPIGAYEPRWYMHPMHMSPEEAARAFTDLGARRLLPIHWATFHLADEPMDEPPRRLYQAMGARANQILFLPIGGAYFPGSEP